MRNLHSVIAALLFSFAAAVQGFAGTPATMTSPTNGTKLTGTSQTFAWSGGSGVTQYTLYVGTTKGAHDLDNINAGTSTSYDVTGLPNNGEALYVTLISLIGGTPYSEAYTYYASGSGTAATLASPANNSTLPGASATFTWSGGVGIDEYEFFAGSAPGGDDIDFKVLSATTTSYAPTNLPTNGEKVYVTLFSLNGNTWLKHGYTFIASGTGTAATISSPTNNSTLPGATATFDWGGGVGIDEYEVFIGSAPGGDDIDFKVLGATVATYSPTNLPTNGEKIYVTLFSLNGNTWLKNAYTYIAAGTGTAASITSPTNGSVFTSANATFTWGGGVGIDEYEIFVGTTAGAHDLDFQVLGAKLTSASVTNLPLNGANIYVTLYSLNGNTWLKTSDTYTAATAPARVVWIPDFYGGLLQVRVGTGTNAKAISISLPSCNPNSVAVNSNQAYVVCSAYGDNPDKILVYNATTIRAASSGTLVISPLQTITSTQFNSLIGITFDASNDLWVASYGNGQVDEITAAQLKETTPSVSAALINSPSSPVALAFDVSGGLWVSGQYSGGIVLHFPVGQIHEGADATPDYCLATTDVGVGCQFVDNVFLNPEGLALFNGDVWVANNATGETGNVPGRELVDLKFSDGTISVNATFGNSSVPADSPFVCPGGLYAGSVHLWVNDESYGEATPQCGAAGDVASATGGVFAFTPAQLAAKTTTISAVLAYSNITGRPGFGGIFVENDQ